MKKTIKTTIFSIVIAMVSFSNLNAQAPYNWTRGGVAVMGKDWVSRQDHRPYSAFFLTSNESVIMGRMARCNSCYIDIYLQKFDANGNLTGSLSFFDIIGGYDNYLFKVGKAITTLNDDIYLTCNGVEHHGDYIDYTYILKLNSNLTVQWIKRIPAVSINNLAADQYGNLYIACIAPDTIAASGKKIQIRKYDGNTGDLLFSTSLKDANGGEIVSLNDFKIDAAGNGYLCGSVFKANLAKRYLVAKISANGTIAWKKYYDGQNAATDDVANALLLDHNNNIIVTGESYYNGKDFDVFTLKYDQNGNILWYKRKDFDNAINRGTNIQLDANNNFYVAGTDGASGSVVFKYDENGNQLWQKRFSNFTINDFKVSATGSSYVASHKNFTGTKIASADKAHIKKLDSNGSVEWVYSDPFNLNQTIYYNYNSNYTNIAINDHTAEVIATGHTDYSYFTASYDFDYTYDWRIDHFSPTARTGNLGANYNTDFNLYPNPVSNQLTLQLKDEITEAQLAIIDLQGREVLTRNLFSNNETLDVTLLKPGIYFVRITYDGQVLNKKFVKE